MNYKRHLLLVGALIIFQIVSASVLSDFFLWVIERRLMPTGKLFKGKDYHSISSSKSYPLGPGTDYEYVFVEKEGNKAKERYIFRFSCMASYRILAVCLCHFFSSDSFWPMGFLATLYNAERKI
ncbi:MAG: hypothetical protein JRI87_12320 [Deltaproteobacteria bacterium]|nr:hypothetical protein [Deltaproteobacteria bacterium]